METAKALRGDRSTPVQRYPLQGTIIALAITVYLAIFLQIEAQWAILGLLTAGCMAVLGAAKFGWVASTRQKYGEHERIMDWAALAGCVILALIFYDNNFVLLLLTTVLVFVIACLGLNLQFGYAGMLNFAGAAMFGIGGYTAAILGTYPSVPSVLMLPAGATVAAIMGTVLLLPMLRTYSHYSAVVTIAFNLLFTTFLNAYGGLGGPEGLPVRSASIFGWSFNKNLEIGGHTASFYINYIGAALLLATLVVVSVRRIERSWIGLTLDAIRLDETVSRCFGMNIAFWKAVAFTAGNFIAGLAGAFYALMIGYVAPSDFTFSDSLILVTIILLGGLGSIWGIILAATIIIVLPEKLQVIHEYRLLLYAVLVTLALLFRPDGLLPRAHRRYYVGWRP